MKILQTALLEKKSEATEENYMKMLEVLPPKYMVSNGFLVGEAYDHLGEDGAPRYAMYYTEKEKFYYAGLATLKDFIMMLIPDEPQEGKIFALTGGTGTKSISNGNSWSESLIN